MSAANHELGRQKDMLNPAKTPCLPIGMIHLGRFRTIVSADPPQTPPTNPPPQPRPGPTGRPT